MSRAKKIYMIGIKGVGMTMLAQFLAGQGHDVSGSDVSDTFLTSRVLRKEKIKVSSPFNIKNIPNKIDIVIHSSAFNEENNVELAWLKSSSAVFPKLEIINYAAALGREFNQYYGIAVCGSHGKTTTSAWLGYVLQLAGREPNVLVGSRVPQFKGSSLLGRSRYFVAEVDEYQNKLQYFQPRGVLLNNIDFDHPDFFKSRSAYRQVFADFIKRLPQDGWLVINQADKEIGKIRHLSRGRVISYRLGASFASLSKVDYLAYDLQVEPGGQSFSVNRQGRFKITLSGEHNIENALAVIAAARELKVPWEAIRRGLAGFKGTERRSQILGHYHGAMLIDDYAHHPTEIKSTLSGLKARYRNRRFITVFHPHTYTRTKALFADFVSSFPDSDELIVLDIYGSAREKQGGVSSRQLVAAIKEYNRRHQIKQTVRHIATIDEAAKHLRSRLQPSDLLLMMGAGDVFRLGTLLLGRQKNI